MTHPAPILLTRPEADSRAFADALRAQAGESLRIVISPLMSITFKPLPPETSDADAVIFTSRNGVKAWEQSGLNVSGAALCVGPATTKAAADLGFDSRQAGATVDEMFEVIISDPPIGPLVHVHGAHTRGDLVQRLIENGIPAQGVVGYDQPLLPLSDEAKALLDGKEQVIVPLFSPRSAAQFARECPKGAWATVIAISPAVAAVAKAAILADRPDGQAMIQAVMSRL